MAYDDLVPPINERNVRALLAPSQRFVAKPPRLHLRDRLALPLRRKSMDLAGWLVCFWHSDFL